MTTSVEQILATDASYPSLNQINDLAKHFGFAEASVCDTDTSTHKQHLEEWLKAGKHGEMEWMENHLTLRLDPSQLLENAQRVITVRLDYLPVTTDAAQLLAQPEKAYISRYSLGRDYHKLMRKRLGKMAQALEQQFGGHYRAAVDSAPVLERLFANKSGLGWIGKNTMLMNRHAGSWFFLGEILTDIAIPLETKDPVKNHCGRCTACLDVCPTQAFDDAYRLDAAKCISYLTIELKGPIPEKYRKAMGNRVFGCDDCQLVCPWNRFAKHTQEDDFKPRHNLNDSDLADLFSWTEEEFLERTAGSPIRRLGYERWLRNLAVGLGNSANESAKKALAMRLDDESALVREHVEWALKQ